MPASLWLWFYKYAFPLIRFCWSTRGLCWNGWLLKKECIRVIFLHRHHPTASQTNTEANEVSQRSHLCGSGRETGAPQSCSSLNRVQYKVSNKRLQSSHRSSFGCSMKRYEWNVFKIKNPSWNSTEQSKSKHFFHFNTKNRTPWKTAGGSKKPTFQYKKLCQIESTSDARSWHEGLSSRSQPGDCLSIIWSDILYWSKKVPAVRAPHRGGKHTPPPQKNQF